MITERNSKSITETAALGSTGAAVLRIVHLPSDNSFSNRLSL